MIHAAHFRELIVRPTLYVLNMWSEAAENLLMGTACQESRLAFLKQMPGPARGIYQCEPDTFVDLWDSWLVYRPEIVTDLGRATGIGEPRFDLLPGNLYYATAICRLDYRREQEPLPDADDIRGLGSYWKRYYNSHKGLGTIEQFVRSYDMVREFGDDGDRYA